MLTCGADAGDKAGLLEHVLSTSTGTSPITAVQTLGSDGKQVNGWTLTGGVNATGSNDLMPVLNRSFTLSLPDKPLSEMTPAEVSLRAKLTFASEASATVTVDKLTATSDNSGSRVLTVTPYTAPLI